MIIKNLTNYQSLNKAYFTGKLQNKNIESEKNNQKTHKKELIALALTSLAILGTAGTALYSKNKISLNNENKILNQIKNSIQQCLQARQMLGTKVSVLSANDYVKAIKKGGFKAKKFITAGGESIVIELKDNTVLKLSPSKYHYNVKDVSVPELSRGKVTIKAFDTKAATDVHYIIQKKVNTGSLTKEEYKKLQQKALLQGCIFTDSLLDKNTIKQSNFGWYLDKNNKKVCVVLDSGVLKRTPERYFYEELVYLNENHKKEPIIKDYFSSNMYQVIFNWLNDNKDFDSIKSLSAETNAVINDFINLANTKQGAEDRILSALQTVFKNHGVPPLKEFDLK